MISKAVPEEERASDGDEAPVVDDGDAVPEEVGLVHEVRRQQDGAPRLVLGQQVPDGAPRVRVHARRRLVQHHCAGTTCGYGCWHEESCGCGSLKSRKLMRL